MKPMKKERIDVLLVEQGFFPTREKARRAVMAGIVYVDEEKVSKPGEQVDVNKKITVKGEFMPYVSRGGLKLEHALKVFNINLNDKIVLDIGASTGGFTDCALQHGAKLVYALDVGYNQLDWKMRSHPQVVTIERCNFRYATLDLFTHGQPEFATIDVSFISLRLILPVLKDILIEDGEVCALVKPQFEAGREQVGKKGIVRDQTVHKEVLTNLINFCEANGYTVLNLTYSPIKGSEGNIEFFLHLKKGKATTPCVIDIEQVITEAHNLASG